eukprot:CAMPEP_0201573352 /NCGR_PEP_ID=MMETSP0190_2-20130828/17154_1 /ASSEMBLY_ACC=CAM_ASM_000263 /TAXON_ID=37353 /ORGANISM="Rosalina sp." /LENGTH=101 /DNA_ID=CAMNT_0048000219 /DNA_START=49 /DNA_END=351 /DNA_ORIENTATION=-
MLTPVSFNSTPITANTSVELELVDDESYSSGDHQIPPILRKDTPTKDSSNGEIESDRAKVDDHDSSEIEKVMQTITTKESITLQPGDETMSREQIPPKPKW